MSGEPHNLEAEENVLGAMLLSPDRSVDLVSEIIGPRGDAFYRRSHQLVYRAILALHGETTPVTAVSVVDFLERFGEIDEAGGAPRIAELIALTPSVGNVSHHAFVIVEQARLRELGRFAKEFEQALVDREGKTADELTDLAEDMLGIARDRYAGTQGEERTAFEMAEYLDERRKNPMQDEEGIPTPWSRLPRMLPGRLYVLAGYAADGKTAMAAEFITRACAHVPVGFATLEMGWEDVAIRMAANLGAPAKQIETGRIRPEDHDRISAAISRLAMMNVRVRYETKPSVSSLRRWQRRHRFGMLVVDHLHQFPIDDARYERQILERIVRELAAMAIAEKVPVLLLSQLSRVGDAKKPFPRPTMASLRGTAIIEQLAWCVWFVWRKRDEKNLATSDAEFIIAKNRSGPTGTFDLSFLERQVRFVEVETRIPFS